LKVWPEVPDGGEFEVQVRGDTNLGEDYYSSAGFYETGVDEFGLLNNLFN
jgi:hypothetical protein